MKKLTVMLAAMALTVACGGSESGPVRPPSEASSDRHDADQRRGRHIPVSDLFEVVF